MVSYPDLIPYLIKLYPLEWWAYLALFPPMQYISEEFRRVLEPYFFGGDDDKIIRAALYKVIELDDVEKYKILDTVGSTLVRRYPEPAVYEFMRRHQLLKPYHEDVFEQEATQRNNLIFFQRINENNSRFMTWVVGAFAPVSFVEWIFTHPRPNVSANAIAGAIVHNNEPFMEQLRRYRTDYLYRFTEVMRYNLLDIEYRQPRPIEIYERFMRLVAGL